jgi:hypothetical protein
MKKSENNIENEHYEFENQSIVPSIAKQLILKYFNGQLVKFDQIKTIVIKKHLKDGGVIDNPKRVNLIISKALQYLAKEDLAENPSYSNWRIGEIISFTEQDIESSFDDNDIEEIKRELLSEEDTVPIENEVGDGETIVYCYYLPAYQELAKINKEEFWPCKIGRTNGDPLIRVLNQVSTSLPEYPNIALKIKTEDSRSLEHAIHNILTLKKRKISSSPGSEWYLTNPDEVIDIYKRIISL